MRKELCILPMTVADIQEAALIEAGLFSVPWSVRGFADALQQDTLFLAAKQGEELVGYCGMYCCAGEGEITNVAVRPGMQGHGIGKRMTGQLLRRAAERGIVRVVLEVRVSNEPAIHLYRCLGFETAGIRKNFYQYPREDAYIMTLESIPTFV